VPADTATLYEGSMEEFNSETFLVQRFQMYVLVTGKAQPLYSWNGTNWHLNRGSCGQAP